jgi:hypothetical protein
LRDLCGIGIEGGFDCRPALGRPDLDRGVDADDQRLALELGVATQVGRDENPALGVEGEIGGLGEDQTPEVAGVGVGDRECGDLLRQRLPGFERVERQAAVDAAGEDDTFGQRLPLARRDGQPPLGIQVVRVAPQKHHSPP